MINWGLTALLTVDTADPFNHGYGADALAFRFSRASILSAPPAYIVQATPNQFYTQRLGSFIRERAGRKDYMNAVNAWNVKWNLPGFGSRTVRPGNAKAFLR